MTFFEWLKKGVVILIDLLPWLIQGLSYLALAGIFYVILTFVEFCIFRKNAAVKKSKYDILHVILYVILSFALAIVFIDSYLTIS